MLPDELLTALLVFTSFFAVAAFTVGVFVMTVVSDLNAKVDRAVLAIGNIATDVRGLQQQIADLLAQQEGGIPRDAAIELSNRLGALADAAEAVDLAVPPVATTPPAEPPAEVPPAEPPPAEPPALPPAEPPAEQPAGPPPAEPPTETAPASNDPH